MGHRRGLWWTATTPATLISRIRKKIETGDRKYIKTVYGIGYQWVGGEAL